MELFDNLNEIKSQLFDAPADIKQDFNNIVQYFGFWNNIKDAAAGAKYAAKGIADMAKAGTIKSKIHRLEDQRNKLQEQIDKAKEDLAKLGQNPDSGSSSDSLA